MEMWRRVVGAAFAVALMVGGPLALVQNGDTITIDVPQRRLELHVSDAEMAARREKWEAPKPKY